MPPAPQIHRVTPREVEDTSPAPYPRPGSIQSERWTERLRHRKITPRTLLVYVTGLAVVVGATPMTATFMAGTTIVVAGLALRIWTFGHLQKNLVLTTTGPYAHTRNPAYLGSALIMVGLFLAAGNPYTPLGLVIWAAGIMGLVVFFSKYLPRKYSREYGQLEQIFPDEIKRHAAHVPNFFPRLTPWRSGDPRRFSWARVQANHELIWPVACALALGLMWLG